VRLAKRRPISDEEIRRLQRSPALFRKVLRVDTDRGAKPLGEVMDDWQRADYEALDAGWENVAWRNKPEAVRRAYLERPRGHDKTSGIATMALWVLFASKYQLTGNVMAADKEQAALVKTAMRRLLRLNSWLARFIEIQQYGVRNKVTYSNLSILSSDAAGGYGQNPDFVICDELTHWIGKNSHEQWATIFSSAGKRRHCMLVVIANAGVGRGKSWQWKVREGARTSPRWYFHRLDGPVASWITSEQLAEQEAMLPASAYRRLWRNEWVHGAGDALEVGDIEAAVVLTGPMAGTADEAELELAEKIQEAEKVSGPMRSVQDGRLSSEWIFAAGLDLGVKNDHSALVVGATKFGQGIVRIANVQSWAPGPDGKVDLIAVRKAVLEAYERYNLTLCAFDPNQALLMAQELAHDGVPMLEMPFTPKNLDMMARDILQAFRSRRIQIYPDERLKEDLFRLTIVERRYGFKLEAISDDQGHADRAIALAIVLPLLMEAANSDPPLIEEEDEGFGDFDRVAV